MLTENVSTLKIHKLTQEQYDRELAAGNIDESALYLTPDEEIDLTPYATKDDLSKKADKNHTHDDRYYTEDEVNAKLDAKQNKITGAATTITDSNLTASRALVSNDSGKVVVSNITSTELGYLDGAKSNIQTQLDGKQPKEATSFIMNNDGGYVSVKTPDRKTGQHYEFWDNDAGWADIKAGAITANGGFVGNLTGNASTATKATQDASGNAITSTYETKTDSSSKLATAKAYADSVATTAANKVKNDLLNGAGGAYDTLKELGDLIDDNTDAIDALEIVAAGKADKSHTHNYAGSSSAGGSATSAVKLDTATAGSATQPVYFSGGKPVACTYTLGKSVPSDAKFTDTTYSAATTSALGLVKIGSNISVSSGTISLTKANVTSALGYTPPTSNTTYSVVTASANGLVPMFDGADGTIDSSSTDWVLTNNNGSIGWYKLPANAFNNTTYSAATQSAQGLMSAADKKKLDGIATGANAYSLPTASSSTLGGVKTTSKVTSTSGLTACPIISGVPYYKDTNTTYSLSSFGITATATELNYTDGVTSNIQTQLNGKAASSHTHSYLPLSGGTVTGATTFNSTVKIGNATMSYDSKNKRMVISVA